MQSGIKRSLLDLQDIFRCTFNHFGDCVTMRVPRDQGPENHHVERPLQHLCARLTLAVHWDPPLELLWKISIYHSNIYGKRRLQLPKASSIAANRPMRSSRQRGPELRVPGGSSPTRK